MNKDSGLAKNLKQFWKEISVKKMIFLIYHFLQAQKLNQKILREKSTILFLYSYSPIVKKITLFELVYIDGYAFLQCAQSKWLSFLRYH